MDRVFKSFADNLVLDSFDLHVRPGEFVSLIGPSGCGKTTALRIAAGLLQPTGGSVFVDGQQSMKPSRDKSIVFQHFNLFPWRTSISNVSYGLEIQGVPKDERLDRAMELLKLVGLESHANHYPGALSGGQKQRVGIARALAIDPKLMLMDEPFGALDALTREYLQIEFQRICVEQNLTVLFVTHSIDEALFLSDRIMVMGVRPGRVIAEFPITLKRPRGEYNFRAEEEYVTTRAEVWMLLQEQLVLASETGQRAR